MAAMAVLYVRNVPEVTYEALRRRAAERKSTIGAEAIRLLDRALRTDVAEIVRVLDAVEKHRPVIRRGAPTAAQLIRRDRELR